MKNRQISLYEAKTIPSAWVVEAIEPEREGICHKAMFYGPDGERQARNFAAAEYGLDLTPDLDVMGKPGKKSLVSKDF